MLGNIPNAANVYTDPDNESVSKRITVYVHAMTLFLDISL